MEISTLEKIELLKDTITQLYSKEGRSKTYISKLLNVNRNKLVDKINEWNLPEPETKHYLRPSTQKFINKHKTHIKACLDKDISVFQIAKELGVTNDFLQRTIIPADEILVKAKQDYINRLHSRAEDKRIQKFENSSYNFDFSELEGEEWKPILGYEEYEISNKGRVKKLHKKYNKYYLLTPYPNIQSNRLYVKIKDKNLSLARLVAHAFIAGQDNNHNYVNHKDGNVQNNTIENLEWVSQSENIQHSFDYLDRNRAHGRKRTFKKIIYKNKYEFKTIEAFSRFINKSWARTSYYVDHPDKYNIKLIY